MFDSWGASLFVNLQVAFFCLQHIKDHITRMYRLPDRPANGYSRADDVGPRRFGIARISSTGWVLEVRSLSSGTKKDVHMAWMEKSEG